MAQNEEHLESYLGANAVFPDAEAIFSWQAKPLESIKDSCLVAIDTSALLLPYEISREALPDIERALQSLVSDDRLRIPGHAAREFAQRRPTKILELFQQINDKKSQMKPPRGGKYPLLEGMDDYERVVKIEDELRRLIADYQEALSSVSKRIGSWEWNDPLSTLYNRVFGHHVVVDLDLDQASITKDLEFRKRHHLPPGYKDAGKDANPAGDLIIWKTILQIGEKEKRDMLLITADRKTDWWHRSSHMELYPRFELVEEYRRASAGHSFHATNLSTLLRITGASDEVVEEVQLEETESEGRLSLSTIADNWLLITQIVEDINRRTGALLRNAWPAAIDDRVIAVETRYPFHLKRLQEPDVRRIIEDVLRQLFGQRLHIRVSLADGYETSDPQSLEPPF